MKQKNINCWYLASGEPVIFFPALFNNITEEATHGYGTLIETPPRIYNLIRLTGTKLGCGEGGCGACTVMLSKYNSSTKTVRHFSANACLVPLCSLHGIAVTTVEGIGSIRNGLHPVQKRLAESHGSQCGFCTPGIVMSMYTLLRNNPQPSMEQMESAFEGNLCRCTGYRPILEGFKTFTKEYCPLGDNCCRNSNSFSNTMFDANEELQDFMSACGLIYLCGAKQNLIEPVQNGDYLPVDPSQDPIFPPELMTDKFDEQQLSFHGERVTWLRPTSLSKLLQLRSDYPDARLVIGNTEVGIEMKRKDISYRVLIAPTHVPELNYICKEEDGIKIGASVTLALMEETLRDAVKNLPESKTKAFQAILEMLRWFGGHQIRNVAAVGGNIMTASPISDLNPLFMAAGVTLEVQSTNRGKRKIKMDEKFFLGYRKTVIKPDELLLSLKLPYTQQNEYIFGYKQAYRREDDIATVNSGIRVLFDGDTNVIKEISMAFGGMAPTTVMPVNTMKQVIGRKWDDNFVTKVSQLLADDLPLSHGAPGGMVNYRRTLTISFLFKFYLSVQMQLQRRFVTSGNKVPSSYRSATPVFRRHSKKSCQTYEEVPRSQPVDDAVGRPLHHMSADKQVTGEAIYVDDLPPFAEEMYLALVFSSKAHANIVQIDTTDALKSPGIVDYIGCESVPGSNVWGPIKHDEEIFASDKVTCMGQIIGAVVADTQAHAQQAAKLVKVKYEELKPVLSIKDAIEADSFFSHSPIIVFGDLEKGFETSDYILEGEVHIGGQEHFYLETQATLAVPKNEDGEMDLYASTQSPTETQFMVAHALGISANKVVVKVKRMGGGFGGKETRSVILSIPVALAASRIGKPVRCMLDRDEDMLCTGTRHPFYGKYQVGFMKDGRIMALDLDIYANCGNTTDVSPANLGADNTGKFSRSGALAIVVHCCLGRGMRLTLRHRFQTSAETARQVLDKGLLHCENSYKIPNLRVVGHMCKTNIASNTAFRGFGGPQGMFIAETYITDVAEYLNLSPTVVREINLYNEGDLTHYNQILDRCMLRRCWHQCLQSSDYAQRRKEIDILNSENRWKKRGLAVVPTKLGISFAALHMNQAGALVMIYKDGSVLLTHGGTEMGQGLHTKMVQVASRALRIPVYKIHISETSTNTVPNTSPTGASASSDLNGMAIKSACETLLERMEPFIRDNPNGSWEDWVSAAYFARVNLATTGFYKTPNIGYDWQSGVGRPYNYFTYGAACSEVEIDCLTGDHQVLRTDIVMDVGISLNPAIDIGQIEGGFVQGYGMFMMEQQKMSPDGFLFTRGPGNYKIPGFGDIPVEFNVSLLKGSINNRTVYSSKGIGEPPLFLAASVFYAARDAIKSARADAGHYDMFQLQSPATPERIRMACEDQFTQQFPEPEEGSYKPWFVEL